ncbi:MAG: hypothetical protein K2W95_30625 [Candidatus Obscuribacterales bacterium]|nr:hypothetical protein [Candidatus Obscuribacterales bacterium]
MSARTLRVLVSLLAVGVVVIYFASAQLSENLPVKVPDAGKPGAPIAGLTKRQLDKFYRCKEVYNKTFACKDGLGPLYNEQSCAACHTSELQEGAPTRSTAHSATYIAKRAAKSRFAKNTVAEARERVEPADVDFMVTEGGPMLLKKSIIDQFPAELQVPADCKLNPVSRPPAAAEFTSIRTAPSLYGLGLLEAIAEGDIIWRANVQQKTKLPVKGKASMPLTEISGLPVVGKFGKKAQHATIYSMCATELGTHLGLSNPCFPHSYSATGVDNLPECIKAATPPDPNATGKLLAQLAYYISLLAPPPRLATDDITPAMEHGSRTFHKLGCAECHIPELRTAEKVYVIDPDGPPLVFTESKYPGNKTVYEKTTDPQYLEIRSLEQQAVPAYSDLLLHSMGKDLADGIPQDSANGGQWRTAPLWGCKSKKSFLHDGRAHTLDAAITAHGGEAESCTKAYKELPQNVKDDLAAFLNAL